MPKPVLYSPVVQELSQSSNINERMVSPKRKNEYFPHLYNVANNVKTSSFNENCDRNQGNIKNVNQVNNVEYNGRYNGNNHQNMVPERDTGPNTMSSGPLNAVGSLRLPVCSNTRQISKGFGENKHNMNEDKMTNSRPHHHMSVHELQMQVRHIFASVLPNYLENLMQCNLFLNRIIS